MVDGKKLDDWFATTLLMPLFASKIMGSPVELSCFPATLLAHVVCPWPSILERGVVVFNDDPVQPLAVSHAWLNVDGKHLDIAGIKPAHYGLADDTPMEVLSKADAMRTIALPDHIVEFFDNTDDIDMAWGRQLAAMWAAVIRGTRVVAPTGIMFDLESLIREYANNQNGG